VMLQALATGHLASVSEGRAAIADSQECSRFWPQRRPRLEEAYARFRALQELKSSAVAS